MTLTIQVFVALLIATGAAVGQAKSCTDPETVKACKSFKELVSAGDKSVVAALKRDVAYTCYIPKEARFFIVSFDKPSELSSLWNKSQTEEDKLEQVGVVFLDRYKDGIDDVGISAVGYWSKLSIQGLLQGSPFFKGQDASGTHVGSLVWVSDNEINVSFIFKNKYDSTTLYSLTIRKSTGRFIETLTDSSESQFSGQCYEVPTSLTTPTPKKAPTPKK